MTRARFRTLMLAAGIVFGTSFSAQAGGKANPSDFGKVIFGTKELQFPDGCVVIDGQMTSGSFFNGLTRSDVRGRFEFRKNGAEVADYPDSVTTSIRVVGNRCGATISNSPSAIFSGHSYSVKFKVEWKDGVQMRPATLSADLAQCEGYSSVVLPYGDVAVPTVQCRMTVQSKGVPLVDHLIVSVLGPDGTRLTRLSAAP
jgi:hypothetical protein